MCRLIWKWQRVSLELEWKTRELSLEFFLLSLELFCRVIIFVILKPKVNKALWNFLNNALAINFESAKIYYSCLKSSCLLATWSISLFGTTANHHLDWFARVNCLLLRSTLNHLPSSIQLLLLGSYSILLLILSEINILLNLLSWLLFCGMLKQILQDQMFLSLHNGFALEETIEKLLKLSATLAQKFFRFRSKCLLGREFRKLIEDLNR